LNEILSKKALQNQFWSFYIYLLTKEIFLIRIEGNYKRINTFPIVTV